MLPPNRNIFRSRWKALLWGAFVCVGALQFAGEQKHDDQDVDSNAALSDAAKALDTQ